jgi:hypothetical protein
MPSITLFREAHPRRVPQKLFGKSCLSGFSRFGVDGFNSFGIEGGKGSFGVDSFSFGIEGGEGSFCTVCFTPMFFSLLSSCMLVLMFQKFRGPRLLWFACHL